MDDKVLMEHSERMESTLSNDTNRKQIENCKMVVNKRENIRCKLRVVNVKQIQKIQQSGHYCRSRRKVEYKDPMAHRNSEKCLPEIKKICKTGEY